MLLMSDPVHFLAPSRRLENICYLTCWLENRSVQDGRTIEVIKNTTFAKSAIEHFGLLEAVLKGQMLVV